MTESNGKVPEFPKLTEAKPPSVIFFASSSCDEVNPKLVGISAVSKVSNYIAA